MTDTPTIGSMAAVGRRLGISREAVRKLTKNRERTGAPMPDDSGQYDIENFATWYTTEFKPRQGPKRGIRAED